MEEHGMVLEKSLKIHQALSSDVLSESTPSLVPEMSSQVINKTASVAMPL